MILHGLARTASGVVSVRSAAVKSNGGPIRWLLVCVWFALRVGRLKERPSMTDCFQLIKDCFPELNGEPRELETIIAGLSRRLPEDLYVVPPNALFQVKGSSIVSKLAGMPHEMIEKSLTRSSNCQVH